MAVVSFEPGSAEFSREAALYLAHASDVAYERKPVGMARERLGVEAFAFRSRVTRARGFLGLADDYAVLVFRGTQPETLANWVMDLSAKLSIREAYTGRVHTGFSASLKSVWPEVERLLPKVDGRPLYLAGHSMGGALAVLTGCRLVKMGVPVVATYTFGAPRVGDDEFCSGYGVPTWRVVNRLDIVPEVPLAGLRKLLPDKPRLTNEKVLAKLHELAGKVRAYGHVKRFVYLDGDGSITIDAEVEPWHAAAVARAMSTRGKSFIEGITDHLIGNYIAALDPAVERAKLPEGKRLRAKTANPGVREM